MLYDIEIFEHTLKLDLLYTTANDDGQQLALS